MTTERDAAILQAMDRVLASLTSLGDAVGEVIAAINVPDAEIPPTGGYEDLRHTRCGTCGAPAYPHPYRHPITTFLPGSKPRFTP